MDDQFTPDIPKLYHYKLQRILGQGGTGRVYLGIDTRHGRPVAVKRFREDFFRNVLHLRDLQKSVKRFTGFKHDNVVQIFEFLDGPEGRCMIMEYVDGVDLRWYLLNQPWDLAERVQIVQQLCGGLQYLHDQKVVHHDFKPANVLFTRRGQAKVADYSLYGSSFLIELLDRGAGEQVTPMFVAPEFLLRQKVTAAADQYSLGITAYMMFAEHVPFPVDSVQKLYQCHVALMPRHPSEVNPKCPRAVGDIVMKLLEKQPDKRYEDCDHVRIALANATRSRI